MYDKDMQGKVRNYMRNVLILFVVFILLTGAGKGHAVIKDYKVYTALCIDKKTGSPFISLRRYESGGKAHLLLVDPYSMVTAVKPANNFKINPGSIAEIRKDYKKTNYVKAIVFAEKNSKPLQNAGIKNFPPEFHGVFVTADLCPSNSDLDRNFFTGLVNAFDKVKSPVPVALSVSGRWLRGHRSDFEWLRGLEKARKISITWVDHSYNHYGSETLSLSKNFLLNEKTDISFEILETEKIMINYGIVPSVFFRFPGLVSEIKLFNRITGFGLIPLGSDSWLDKGQKPKYGSIILVHANGNAPAGIRLFFKLLDVHRESIARKYWSVYDIKEGAEKLK
jgi:hypothetical protein